MELTEYIKSLNLNPEKIEEMPDGQAKEILKILVALINEEKK